jgi:hydrogenase expression/formation protein HypC
MCLAIPGRVLEIETASEPLMGKVSFGGINKRVCLDWVPEVKVGEYVVVHVGFAISKMDEEEAEATLKLIEAMEDGFSDLSQSDASRPGEA